MAEGTFVQEDDVVCRFFLTSTCRDGDNCLFSHDSQRRTPDNVCRYFLKGVCSFGHYCRFDHSRISKEHNSPSARRHVVNRDTAFNLSGTSDTQTKNSKLSGSSFLSCSTVRNEAFTQNEPLAPTTENWTNVSEFPRSASFPNWMHVPEFVPKSYADTVKGKTSSAEPEKLPSSKLCLHFMMGECPLEQYCSYVHGDLCELCQKACLHPEDETQRKHHIEQCEKALEEDMEFSFAVQRSKSKTCAICMDVVLEKEPLSERRFGILEKCNHVYCLSCIRQWRRGNKRNNEGVDNVLDPALRRSCPQCRIPSDFVTPSSYFADSEEEKNKLISDYKKALGRKHCKYFKNGEGSCPFGLTCFYLHAKRDGTKVQLPPSVRRRCENQFGEVVDIGEINLFNFYENRDENVLINFNFSQLNFSASYTGVDSNVTNVSE